MKPKLMCANEERKSWKDNCQCGKKKCKIALLCKKCHMELNWRDEKHYGWKGDKVNKKTLHTWVRRRKPKKEFCECCGQKPNYRLSLDLANISQQYKRDINDFEWLCRKCHMTKDKRMKNLKRGR